MEWVGDGCLLSILVLADDELDRLRHASVDVPEDSSSSQLRRDLSAPKNIVGAGKALGDLAGESGGGGGG